jgi:flagellar hook protein FlgE
MLRSLWSGVSGLNIHQTQLDVIGNNIANVNTTGYKSSSTNFSDLFYQTASRAMGATDVKGSISAKQIGLGGRTASIDVHITKGGPAISSDSPFHMMIGGSNFFIVNGNGRDYYTRDGSFTVDAEGNLVNSQGFFVQGWTANDGEVNTTGATGPIDLLSEELATSPAEATTDITVSGNIDRTDSLLQKGRSMMAAFYDAKGNQYNINLTLTDAGDTDNTTYKLIANSVTDSKGKKINMAAQEFGLKFDPATGKITGTTEITFNAPGDAGGGSIKMDLSRITNYDSKGSASLTFRRGDADGNGAGRLEGQMSGLSVKSDGTIHATYTNGEDRLVAQIATAQFPNASGLTNEGNNLYSASSASGEADVMPVTDDGGSISAGVLEGSNVDLADEFTRMITAQRAFQANSRVITTSDSMLQELRHLKA